MKRRSFIQVLSAAIASLSLNVKNLFARPVKVTPVLEDRIPGLSGHTCCYIYNPGLDVEGIRGHCFGQTNVLKGGQITKIITASERVIQNPGDHIQFTKERVTFTPNPRTISPSNSDSNFLEGGPFATPVEYTVDKEGLLHTVFSVIEPFTPSPETHYLIPHKANEIAGNLINIHGKHRLVIIYEWNDKNVDLTGVNDLLAGASLKAREANVRKIPRAWRISSVLLTYIPRALKDFETHAHFELNRIADSIEHWQINLLDRYTKNLCVLVDRNAQDFFRMAYSKRRSETREVEAPKNYYKWVPVQEQKDQAELLRDVKAAIRARLRAKDLLKSEEG